MERRAAIEGLRVDLAAQRREAEARRGAWPGPEQRGAPSSWPPPFLPAAAVPALSEAMPPGLPAVWPASVADVPPGSLGASAVSPVVAVPLPVYCASGAASMRSEGGLSSTRPRRVPRHAPAGVASMPSEGLRLVVEGPPLGPPAAGEGEAAAEARYEAGIARCRRSRSASPHTSPHLEAWMPEIRSASPDQRSRGQALHCCRLCCTRSDSVRTRRSEDTAPFRTPPPPPPPPPSPPGEMVNYG